MRMRSRRFVAATMCAVVATSASLAVAASESGPTVSVAYLAGGRSGSWISIVKDRGRVPRRLSARLTNANAYPSLVWSPDGRSLAFAGVAPQGERHGLFVIDRKGGLRRWRSLDKRSASALELSWSQAGDAIAYDVSQWRATPGDDCSDPGVEPRIDITRSNGSTIQLRAAPAGERVTGTLDEIRWKPDGSRLLYVVRHWTLGRGEECDWASSDLLTVDVAGGRADPLLRGSQVSSAEWSPDGKSIAFDEFSTEDNYAHWNLYVMRADGSERKRLATNILHFAWSKDGRTITVVRNGLVQAVDVRTGRVRLLAERKRTADPWWLPVFRISSGWVAVERDTQDNSRYETIRTEIWFIALDGGPDHTLTITPRGAERWIGSIAVSPS